MIKKLSRSINLIFFDVVLTTTRRIMESHTFLNQDYYKEFFDEIERKYFIFKTNEYSKFHMIDYIIIDKDTILKCLQIINKNIDFPFFTYQIRPNFHQYLNTININIQQEKLSIIKYNFALRYKEQRFDIVIRSSTNNKNVCILSNNNVLNIKYGKIKGIGDSINNFAQNPFSYELFKIINKNNHLLKELDINDFKHIKINFEIFKKLQNKQDLIEYLTNKTIPFNLNKIDFILGYSFASLIQAGVIEKKDWQKLYEYCLLFNKDDFYIKTKLNLRTIKIKIGRKQANIINLPYYFYIYKINNCLDLDIEDTIKMHIELKKPLNLGINSPKRIKTEHDKILKNYLENSSCSKNDKALKINPYFKNLKLPKNIEIIKTENRLKIQGLIQCNCVNSYKNNINQGKIAILSIEYQNKLYTAEISFNKRTNQYRLKQLKGKHNAEAPIEAISYLANILLQSR